MNPFYLVGFLILISPSHCFPEILKSSKEDYDFIESVQGDNLNSEFDYQPIRKEQHSSNWECGVPSTLSHGTDDFDFLISQRSAGKSPAGRDSILLKPEQFILNGTEVRRGEIPWMVAITKFQHRKNPLWKVICGGTLLNEKFVLTAAHCLQGRFKDTLEVVFNADDATNIANDEKVVRRKIQRIITHPGYNSSTVENDIALIELKVPLDASKSKLPNNLWPACLPQQGKDFGHAVATVSGWGYTEFDPNKGVQGPLPTHLRKLNVPVLTHAECLETNLPKKHKVSEEMLCAGFPDEGGKDACVNDSGGPLTVKEGGRNYVVGIVSWGIGCGLKGYPGVYTKVSAYVDWIRDNISV